MSLSLPSTTVTMGDPQTKRRPKANYTSLRSRLVVANLDKPNLLTKDLWVDSEEWEAQTFKCFQAKSDKKSVGEEDDDDDDEDDEEYEA
ncbi:hypothetical protein V501_03385 [Pseudogymnoascus sp. VKM F-4519 (FW-2642)]|nr:hypothetical protein V501_03385 [Pseudogymnoascus sp. VKM F-4519 (FW-2642)]